MSHLRSGFGVFMLFLLSTVCPPQSLWPPFLSPTNTGPGPATLFREKVLREFSRAGVIQAERTVATWGAGRKRERKMKTRIVITVIGAAVLTAIILNLNAAAPLLSPRAKDRQIKASPTPARDRNLANGNRDFPGSPQALDKVAKALPATKDDVSLATLDRNASGCLRGNEAIPKTIVAGGCCATAKTANAAPPACCVKQ